MLYTDHSDFRNVKNANYTWYLWNLIFKVPGKQKLNGNIDRSTLFCDSRLDYELVSLPQSEVDWPHINTVLFPSKQVSGSHNNRGSVQYCCTPISFPSPVAVSEAVRPAASGSQISIDAIYRLTSFVPLLDSWAADGIKFEFRMEVHF